MCWRIQGCKGGVLRLQFLQCREQYIVFCIGDDGIIQDVVAACMGGQDGLKGRYYRFRLLRIKRGVRVLVEPKLYLVRLVEKAHVARGRCWSKNINPPAS